jgi:glycerol kinase
MGPLALAIDQGTTGTTALVIDRKLAVKAKVNLEFRQIFPRPGWVEHDLEDVWASVVKAVGRALREARVKGAAIAAIGITNQRETTAPSSGRTAAPPTPAPPCGPPARRSGSAAAPAWSSTPTSPAPSSAGSSTT